MRQRCVLEILPYHEGLFNALTNQITGEELPFSALTPRFKTNEGVSLRVVLPETTIPERIKRVRIALRRILESHVSIRIHHDGFEGVSSWSEFQLWTMGNWVRGSIGSSEADAHFMRKTIEEYHEAAHDIHYDLATAPEEIIDWLFCVSAVASNNFIDLHDALRQEIDSYTHSDAITDHKDGPVLLGEFDELATDVERFRLYIDNIEQRESENGYMRKEVSRALSVAMVGYWQARLLLEDEEIDFPDDREWNRQEATRLLGQSVFIALMTTAKTAGDQSVQDVVNTVVEKLNARLAEGRPITRF